jgi:type I restriction enzyme S subunit
MSNYPTYKLGDVAEIILGQSPESKSYNTKGEGLPFFQGKTEFTDWFPIPNKWCTEPKKIAEPFDVLLSVRAPVGPTNIAKEKCCIGRGLAAIRYADCYKYVLYYLRSVSKYLESKATGTTFSSISGDTIKNLPIPLPPLPTQRAIVTRIEALFAELDKAAVHLRTAQQQLKTYRQAVLNHWLNNEEGKWEMVKLGNIADVNTGSTPKRGNKDYWENGNIPWITSGETNNPYITKATEFITTKAIAETNCKIIAKGSLVIAMYGEGKTRGKCAELSIDATTNQALASITFTDSRMYKNFAKWFFEKNYEDMRMLSSGGVQPNLNLGIIKNMILPLPPLAEQQRIVKEIESRLSQATASETYIENALQQAEALRQSILKKAFSGELV